MQSSFCQLFLFLLIIINSFQYRNCFDANSNENQIYQKLYTATNRTLSSIVPPLCSQVLLNQNNIQSSYISSGGLSGRIIPAGTFTTHILALEYLYGILCPIPNLPAREDVLKAFDLIKIAYDKQYYITQSVFIFNLTNGKRLTFFASMAFDKDYKLCGYDGQIRNLGLTIDTYSDADHQAQINLVCTVAQQFCNGSLKQYASVAACVQYLTTHVPYGSFDSGDQGNVACRLLHTNFVPLLPSVHCVHVGPTGGDACSNKTIDFYYNQPNFLGCAHKYN